MKLGIYFREKGCCDNTIYKNSEKYKIYYKPKPLETIS